MKRRALALLLLLLTLPALAVPSALKEEQHKATMTIVMVGEPDSKRAGCSATAIAPHVLLTAEHCNVQDGTLYLDQNTHPFQNPLTVTEKYFDKNDHMLMVVPGVEFKHYIGFDPNAFRTARQGEHVYLWGNPALMMDQYREGYATGTMSFASKYLQDINASGSFTMLAVPIVGGDSGSAVFSEDDGGIVGVTTWGINYGMFLGSYPLQFTAEQVAQAKGEGNFAYIPAPTNKQRVVVNVTVSPNGDLKNLTTLFSVFLALYAVRCIWSTVLVFTSPFLSVVCFLFSVLSFIGRSVKNSLLSSAKQIASDFRKGKHAA